MTDQHGIGGLGAGPVNDLCDVPIRRIGVQKADIMARINQRTSEAEKTKRRQVFLRDPAADGRVGRVEKQGFHAPEMPGLPGDAMGRGPIAQHLHGNSDGPDQRPVRLHLICKTAGRGERPADRETGLRFA